MDVKLRNNPVIEAMRAKAAAGRRAIICYPFREGGQMLHSKVGRCVVRPDGGVFCMGQRVACVEGSGRVEDLAPQATMLYGVVVVVRLDDGRRLRKDTDSIARD